MIRAKKIENDKNIRFVMKTFATVTKTFHVNHTKVHVLCCSNPPPTPRFQLANSGPIMRGRPTILFFMGCDKSCVYFNFPENICDKYKNLMDRLDSDLDLQMRYSKPCLKWPLKKRPNIGFTYCRSKVLQNGRILQYF